MKPLESFNARSLTPREVARTFVPPEDDFRRLLRNSHTVLLGPRGSGKTTLLKMLSAEAQDAWEEEARSERYERPTFLSVFVPADVAWNHQLRAVQWLDDTTTNEVFDRGAFAAHILRSWLHAVRYEVLEGRRVRTLSKEKEAEFAVAVAEAWQLPLRLPSMEGLLRASEQRLQEIYVFASRERLLGPEGRAERIVDEPALNIGFIPGLTASLTAGEQLLGWETGQRWALCFDELELAPERIRQELLIALRSSDDRLVFKLSLAPFGEEVELLDGALAADRNQDYEVVSLTSGRKEAEARRFTRDLVGLVLTSQGIGVTPDEFFGRSSLEDGNTYRQGSAFHRSVVALAETDPTFVAYLDRLNIDLRAVFRGDVPAPPGLRKVRQIVPLRAAYKSSTPRQAVRSRKRPNVELYEGADALLTLVEGNPRRLIGVATHVALTASGNRTRARPGDVLRAVDEAVASFRAQLRAIPLAPGPSQSRRGLVGLLDSMGDYFHDRMVRGDFDPEPPGSFIIDSTADASLIQAIGQLLNAGALVFVPDKDETPLLASLRGKRFRLSFFLSPHYGLPTRLGPPTALSRVLSGEQEASSVQSLFADDDGTSRP